MQAAKIILLSVVSAVLYGIPHGGSMTQIILGRAESSEA
jgi:hypothetical protein